MAEVSINIGANTSQATAAVEELNSALGQTGAEVKKVESSSDDLAKSLERQEAQIKVIDGAVNLLGGSVELAAGAFVGLGLASEEQAGQFESAALGAIAFADGAKRTLDGVKSLNEGLKSFGGVAGLARKAQLALNTAVLANPYVLAAAAVAALAAALVIYANRETEAEKATKLALETSKLRLQNLEDSETRVLSFARAQGIAAEEVLAFEQASVKARIAEIDRILALEEDAEEYKRLSEEQRKLLDKEVELALATGKIKEDARQKDIENNKKANETKLKDDKEAAQKRFDELNKENTRREDALRTHEENLIRIAKDAREQRLSDAKFLADVEAEDDAEAFEKELELLEKRKQAGIKRADDARKVADALKEVEDFNIANVQNGIAALGSLFAEGTAAAKAAAIADIAINTALGFIQGLDIAQKTAKAAGPGAALVFPLFYASQVAAVLAAANSAKQILATTPGGGGGGSAPRPSIPGPPTIGNAGFTGALPGTEGASPAFGFNLGRQEPVRAYVISQDVSNGQEANAAIRRRRRLGPG